MTDQSRPGVVLELSSVQRKELHGALLDAFPTIASLARLVDFELGENLSAISSAGSLGDIAYELIKWAQAHGALDSLVNAARNANPGNPRLRRFDESIVRARNARPEDPELRQFADQVSLAPGPAAAPTQVEQIVRDSQRFQSVDDWRRGQSRGELAVCRIETAKGPTGTGFLVGADLVMTAYCVIEGQFTNKLPPKEMTVRFDYRAYGDGQTLSQGQAYPLSDEPIVDSSPVEALDYALLRIAGQPGGDPIAGQSGAPPRGWLTPRAHTFEPGELLFVIQHPEGEPLKFAHGPFMEKPAGASFAEPGPIEPRILYRVPTAPGSGGAPVFSSDWDLVGIHEGLFSFERRDVKRGVSMTLIIERLRGRGIVLTEQGSQQNSVQLE